MTDHEAAVLATALIFFALGTGFGFAAGRARIREAVRSHARRTRYRRVGSSK